MAYQSEGPPSAQQVRFYLQRGWWSDEPLGDLVRRRGAEDPDGVAYYGPGSPLTWASYDQLADRMAGQLAGLQLARGSRVAVFMPDSALTHVTYVACERAGLVVVAIPDRAGDRELVHLVERTQAELLVCPPTRRGRTSVDLVDMLRGQGSGLHRHAELFPDGTLTVFDWTQECRPVAVEPAGFGGRQLLPSDLWLLNSTSGTTGLPKCVRQTQNRWFYLLSLAREASGLGAEDVLMSLVPSPFGFGLWTAHFAPAVLGVPCVLQERFDAGSALRSLAEHRVTVLACVSTQFQLMLASPVLDEVDLSSLRVLYTGGENVPPARAREWERRTGSTVLQFYGSNEIGPFSCTALSDPEELRLTTVGRLATGLDCRLYDDNGGDVTETGGAGQPGGRSPGSVGGGYWNDPAASDDLYSRDGYMLMPDLVTLDDQGYVRITGRKSDIIIRGGKNISVSTVEADVQAHPAVDMVAVVPVPDAVFGERVCAVVSLRAPDASLDLPELVDFLAARGVSKEYFPEYLAVVDEMPQSIGGKVAKSELRARLPDLLRGG